jgi:probable O-glycosylation ligase (exosortase A-associated)
MKGLIFTYAATFGGAIVSLVKPYYGFLIYVAFANLKPDSLWHWSVPQGNYSRIVAVAFLFGWLLHGGGNWRFGKANVTVLALLGFWGWALVGTLTSPAQADAWGNFWGISKIYLPFLAGVTLINSLEKLKQLAWVIVITQGYLAFQIHLDYYAGNFHPMDWKFAEQDNNTFAISMVASAGVALFLGLHTSSWWRKGLAFTALAFMGHMVLFSMSRGGMLAMCVTGLTAIWLIPKRPVHLFALAMIGLAMVQLAGKEVREEFATIFAKAEERDFSAQSRFDLSRDALDCMLKNPLFGCGLDNWGNVAADYGWPKGKEAHNTWLQMGAELGFPGLLSLLAFYGLTCWRLLPLSRENTDTDPALRPFARMVIASATGFCVAAAAVTCEGVEVPYYIMALGAGTLRLHSAYLEQAGFAEHGFSDQFLAPPLVNAV